jgi:hypothetical protein
MSEDGWTWELSSTAEDDLETFRQNDSRLIVARIKRRGGAYTADDD